MKSGDLCAIVGETGSGKTSLLMALLNEIPNVTGNININGRMVYVKQEPFIFPGTIKQNILFGQQYDRIRFEDVIIACRLSEVSFESFSLNNDQ